MTFINVDYMTAMTTVKIISKKKLCSKMNYMNENNLSEKLANSQNTIKLVKLIS